MFVIVLMTSFVLWGILVSVVNNVLNEAVGGLLVVISLPATAWLLWRVSRISVTVSRGLVTVKNLWRTHSMQAADVDRVEKALIAIGPLPVATIGLGCKGERRWVRILALAGSSSDQAGFVDFVRHSADFSDARVDDGLG
jgi:hypothetical protein